MRSVPLETRPRQCALEREVPLHAVGDDTHAVHFNEGCYGYPSTKAGLIRVLLQPGHYVRVRLMQTPHRL